MTTPMTTPMTTQPVTTQYAVKDTLFVILESWGVEAKAPTKKNKVCVSFPGVYLNYAEIKVSKHKSTYNKTLYSIEFYHL